ncbi:primosomal protein N' [Halomonas denitrificans]|uniref:primosomal protein N' n=1 Tax=Halomonas TaxID=2745 RepID=UPI001C951706|nr:MULTISPECIES: primosomal protein N' [Halomonas]MBY5927844.1 primosomal protein N' [Halomonas sp. DP8Y7-3]MBY6028889.1 primosomal protein N' [Halomonas sp. DP8Y7-1]MCA0976008.1 primosomal protein N' [Halomonas denitrificans]
MPDTPAPRVLRIAIPSPLRRLFDYRPGGPVPPDGWQEGLRVRVEFGRRQVVGVIVACADDSDFPLDKLKPIQSCIDSTPLPADWLWLCRFTARYYQHALGDTLAHAMPVLLRQGRPLQARTRERWMINANADRSRLGRAPRQAALLEMLGQHPHGLTTQVVLAQSFSRDQLGSLEAKGLIIRHEEALAAAPTDDTKGLLASPALSLNDEQAKALNRLHQGLDRFHPCLLHGVTGSGKTEVYLQLIEAVAAKGRQTLVLIPEIGLTPQTLGRFRQRFRVPVVALHSGLTDHERLDAWEAAASGRALIIIGTRSAIFTPLARPGLIIVDEEHDGSFKQQDGLRYHARDLAVVRAKRDQIPLLLGSATPSLESLHRALTGDYAHLRLTKRATRHAPARLELVDLKGRTRRGGLIPPVIDAIKATLSAGHQVLVFINRRGFAPTLSCHACGWMADCDHCDARMTWHRQPPMLACHHCDRRRVLPDACPECGSADLRPLGSGTERTEESLAESFPDVPVHRIDRDSTRTKDALEKMLTEVRRGEPAILVGTQMLAKGHHLPHVTLVVVVNADAGLYASDFRALEHSAQLLEQVAGRAGRAAHPGRVLVQTMHPDDPNLRLLADRGYDALAQTLLDERRIAALPPYRFMALLRMEGPREEALTTLARELARELRDHIKQQALELDCLGPVPAPMERRQNRYHLQLALMSDKRSQLHPALAWLAQRLEAWPDARRVRWSIDVDPQSLS